MSHLCHMASTWSAQGINLGLTCTLCRLQTTDCGYGFPASNAHRPRQRCVAGANRVWFACSVHAHAHQLRVQISPSTCALSPAAFTIGVSSVILAFSEDTLSAPYHLIDALHLPFSIRLPPLPRIGKVTSEPGWEEEFSIAAMERISIQSAPSMAICILRAGDSSNVVGLGLIVGAITDACHTQASCHPCSTWNSNLLELEEACSGMILDSFLFSRRWVTQATWIDLLRSKRRPPISTTCRLRRGAGQDLPSFRESLARLTVQ